MSIGDDFSRNLRDSAMIAGGLGKLGRIRDEDVDIATTPKDEVFRSDRTVLHHYRPLDGIKPETGPILIVYSLIGRYTVIDLQEDRSLVRNLLGRGCDLYVVDWGSPSRAPRRALTGGAPRQAAPQSRGGVRIVCCASTSREPRKSHEGSTTSGRLYIRECVGYCNDTLRARKAAAASAGEEKWICVKA